MVTKEKVGVLIGGWPQPIEARHNARLKPLPFTAVKLTDRFWSPRLRTNRDGTLTEIRLLAEPKK